MLHYDPVCGKRLNRNKAHIEIEYRGQQFLLCCPRCQAEFELNPAKYVREARKKHRSGRRKRQN
jgi:YHS domain-containing protein